MAKTLEIKIKEFRDTMNRFGMDTDDEFGKLLKKAHSSFMSDLVKATPPPEHIAAGSGMSSKKLGEKAVEGDIKRLFTGLTESLIKFNQRLNIPSEILNPSGAGMEQHHEQKRNRKGRVVNPRRIVTKRTIDGQTFEYPNKQIVPKAMLNAYIKKRQARVGRLKKGWLAEADGVNVNVPGWIKNVPVPNESMIELKLDGSLKSITTDNKVPYGVAAGLERIVALSTAIQERKIEKSLLAVMNHFEKKFAGMN